MAVQWDLAYPHRRAVNKQNAVNVGVANTDTLLYTVSPTRTLYTTVIHIENTEAGLNRVRIWDGPSVGGNLKFDFTLGGLMVVDLDENCMLDFKTSIIVQEAAVVAARGIEISFEGKEE